MHREKLDDACTSDEEESEDERRNPYGVGDTAAEADGSDGEAETGSDSERDDDDECTSRSLRVYKVRMSALNYKWKCKLND